MSRFLGPITRNWIGEEFYGSKYALSVASPHAICPFLFAKCVLFAARACPAFPRAATYTNGFIQALSGGNVDGDLVQYIEHFDRDALGPSPGLRRKDENELKVLRSMTPMQHRTMVFDAIKAAVYLRGGIGANTMTLLSSALADSFVRNHRTRDLHLETVQLPSSTTDASTSGGTNGAADGSSTQNGGKEASPSSSSSSAAAAAPPSKKLRLLVGRRRRMGFKEEHLPKDHEDGPPQHSTTTTSATATTDSSTGTSSTTDHHQQQQHQHPQHTSSSSSSSHARPRIIHHQISECEDDACCEGAPLESLCEVFSNSEIKDIDVLSRELGLSPDVVIKAFEICLREREIAARKAAMFSDF